MPKRLSKKAKKTTPHSSIRPPPFKVGDKVVYVDAAFPKEKKIIRVVDEVKACRYSESGYLILSSEVACRCCGAYRSTVDGLIDSGYFRGVRKAPKRERKISADKGGSLPICPVE